MGVPAFFRWLSVRYPKVILNALTEDELEYLYDDFKKTDKQDPNEIDLQSGDLDGDIQQKIKENNPEFDNLYLDMNGIIHPCCHPQGQPQPKSEIEMFNNIFEYTDKVIKIVKPKKLLYLAVDGVAPRAKMNQQRARRFRSALDVEERQQREEEIRGRWSKEGIKFADKPTFSDDTKWDQNVITPGTEFMQRLTKALQYYIMERLHTHKDWRGIKVVFSDASIPGEGEHKILDFIRSQRTQPGYDPNTRHCIYGADADLIMLGLSTHEPHFCILREAVLQKNELKCPQCGKQGHLISECDTAQDLKQASIQLSKAVQFQFIKINVVREYLYLEFKEVQLPFPFDFERIVDDFVFLCFFVGNDFLPHLPSLHIREGAIDAMMVIYKNLLPSLGDYLTKGGVLDFSKIDLILNDISKIEEEFFRMRKEQNERFEKRQQQQKSREEYYKGRDNRRNKPEHIKFDQPKNISQSEPQLDQPPKNVPASNPVTEELVDEAISKQQEVAKNEQQLTAQELENKERKELEEMVSKGLISQDEVNDIIAKKFKKIVTQMINEKNDQMAKSYVDTVQFGTDGWKIRYYRDKFHVHGKDLDEFITKIKQAYIEGLQWVYSYYYKGCASWYWFYPFHYAPFASDLLNSDRIKIEFEMGEPASAFEQLMAVMPRQSAHCLPKCYRHLLQSPDSEIIDFYPINFKLDVNGARYAWMGVNLLPFIERQRLVKAMKNAEKDLTETEKERNSFGNSYLFFESDQQSRSAIQQTLSKADINSDNFEISASYKRLDMIGGTIKGHKKAVKLGQSIKQPYGGLDLEDINKNQILQVRYEVPSYEKHLTQILEGAILPLREVEDFEIYHVDRRFFQGEAAIRMLQRILGIDITISTTYKSYNYSAYQNNYAQYDQAKYGTQRTSVESYIQQQQYTGKRRYREEDQEQQSYQSRRQRTSYNTSQQQQYSNPYYQQPPNQQQQQQINYNLNQYNAQQQYYQQPPPQYNQVPPQQTANNLMDLLSQFNQQVQRQQQYQQQQQQQPQMQNANRFDVLSQNDNRNDQQYQKDDRQRRYQNQRR